MRSPAPDSPRRVTVLLLGDAASPELAPVAAALSGSADIDCRFARSVESAAFEIAGDPDLVVVGQQWPDEFTSADVQTLVGRFPLARWVCVYGPWCDADGRSRTIWPLAVRVAAGDAVERVVRELAAIRGERGPILPLTASRNEAFADSLAAPWPQCPRPMVVAIVSPDRAWRTMLETALRAGGASVTDDPAAADVLVWDVDPGDVQQTESLAATIRGRSPDSLILAQGFRHVGLPPVPCRAVLWKLSPLGIWLERIFSDIGTKWERRKS